MRPLLIILALSLAMASCRQKAANPESLMPPGDIESGKVAFQELRCWSCHEIHGGGMPASVASPKMPVYLGGTEISAPSDAYLVRAIVDPSHELAQGWGTENVQSGNLSRMGDYSRIMTARQLIDLVAFLKSRYSSTK